MSLSSQPKKGWRRLSNKAKSYKSTSAVDVVDSNSRQTLLENPTTASNYWTEQAPSNVQSDGEQSDTAAREPDISRWSWLTKTFPEAKYRPERIYLDPKDGAGCGIPILFDVFDIEGAGSLLVVENTACNDRREEPEAAVLNYTEEVANLYNRHFRDDSFRVIAFCGKKISVWGYHSPRDGKTGGQLSDVEDGVLRSNFPRERYNVVWLDIRKKGQVIHEHLKHVMRPDDNFTEVPRPKGREDIEYEMRTRRSYIVVGSDINDYYRVFPFIRSRS